MGDEIKRLMNSPNPDDRRTAIRKLAEWGDESALPYLSAIYKTDSDPAIRELAAKAGRYIRHQMANPGPPRRAAVQPRPADDEPEDEQPLTDEQQAKEWMKRAKEELDDGNLGEAQILAARAFARFRDLKHDEYYVGLLAQIMEVEREDAVAALVEYIRTGGKSAVPKGKKGKKHLDETTFGDLMFYYLLIALVSIGGLIVMNVGVALLLQPRVRDYNATLSTDVMALPETQLAIAAIQSVVTVTPEDLATTAAAAAGRGIGALISMTIAFFFINFVANSMAGGKGTFNGLVRAALPVNLLSTVSTYIISGAFLYFYMSHILEGVYLAGFYDNPALFADALTRASTELIPLYAGGLGVVGVLSLLFFVMAVARNYEIGFLEGCASIVVAAGVAACSWCGLIYLFAQVFGGVASLF
jgi:hypothetical protein